MIDRIKTYITDVWRGNLLGGVARSGQWPKIQKEFLRDNPICAVCEKKGTLLRSLNIHHVIPFSEDKSKELLAENLITLCRPDHLLFGHLNSWASFNSDVRADCLRWRLKIQNRP